jgi:hypothetical protein
MPFLIDTDSKVIARVRRNPQNQNLILTEHLGRRVWAVCDVVDASRVTRCLWFVSGKSTAAQRAAADAVAPRPARHVEQLTALDRKRPILQQTRPVINPLQQLP